jgi:tetratricopeptide (TPR) repeat protein
MLSWQPVCFASSGTAAPADRFAAANRLYQQGDFSGAEQAYLELLSGGIQSAEVFYNLGNACFKQRKLGQAIYFWEKARRRLPGDSDARENLELARSMVIDRIEVPEDPLPVRWVSAAVHWMTPTQEAWLALCLFLTANLFLALYLLVPRPRAAAWTLSACLAFVLLFAAAGGSLAWKIYEQRHRRQGVIVAQTIEVRSGPGPGYMAVATVHEGTEIRVRGEAEDWHQISLPNGWSGWLPKASLLIF